MPSNAYENCLIPLLGDADELEAAHAGLRTGAPGRQYGLAALNRAAVVVCVSAWEAYVEEVVRESVSAVRPAAPPLGTWPALQASVGSLLGRFNTPNADQVRQPLSNAIGLADIRPHWFWQNCTAAQARDRLDAVLTFRHRVAHGVNPRPVIHNRYSSRLPDFFRRLGRRTDDAVREYLVGTLGVMNPWPA